MINEILQAITKVWISRDHLIRFEGPNRCPAAPEPIISSTEAADVIRIPKRMSIAYVCVCYLHVCMKYAMAAQAMNSFRTFSSFQPNSATRCEADITFCCCGAISGSTCSNV